MRRVVVAVEAPVDEYLINSFPQIFIAREGAEESGDFDAAD